MSIKSYALAIRLGAWTGNQKAKKWLNGRKNWQSVLQEKITPLSRPIIWIHCPSLGEFEQARPVIEGLKQKYPSYALLLSFFSPSGYEIRQHYTGVEAVVYLPLDTHENAQKFIEIVKPHLVVWTKYDFWYHFLTQLKKQQVPTFLIAARFRQDQWLFKIPFLQQILESFEKIFVQEPNSQKILEKAGLTQGRLAPDTRFDRVFQHAKAPKTIEAIETFRQNALLLVAGSTWPKDEAILLKFIEKAPSNLKLLLAPHEIKEKSLQKLIQSCPYSALRFTENPTKQELNEAKILILDIIGLLSSAYQYGDFSYIGGGFGAGIHNTLEAAVFGTPIFIGPRYQKFQEAHDLIRKEVAFVIESEVDLHQVFSKINEVNTLQLIQQKAKRYVSKHTGGTQIILECLKDFL